MINKKYQIFVSSTYEDLKDERQKIIKAILEMGHIPVGMEMFNAADEDQWQIINKTIRDCDYYVVIIAHRYGSMKNNKSYTQLEYEYAKSEGLPVLGFIISDDASWPNNKTDTDPNKLAKLKEFKELTKSKMVDFWKDQSELESKFIKSIHKAFNIYERVGWVKASEAPSASMAEEMSRLSSENNELRETLKKINPLHKASEKSMEKMIKRLQDTKLQLSIKFDSTNTWEFIKEISLWTLFEEVSINLNSQVNTVDALSTTLARVLTPKSKKEGRTISRIYPIAKNTLSEWLRNLDALGLMRNILDGDFPSNSWAPTPEGKNLYNFYLKKKTLGKTKL